MGEAYEEIGPMISTGDAAPPPPAAPSSMPKGNASKEEGNGSANKNNAAGDAVSRSGPVAQDSFKENKDFAAVSVYNAVSKLETTPNVKKKKAKNIRKLTTAGNICMAISSCVFVISTIAFFVVAALVFKGKI